MSRRVIWGKLLNRWHDEGQLFHALDDGGAPLCGVKYRSSTGEYPYPPPSKSHCCTNCLRIVEGKKRRR